MTTDQPQRYAKVPAEMSRAGWQRNAGHVATAGDVAGTGTSMQAALDSLAASLAQIAARVNDAPMFGWDEDNRMLWAAVPSAHDGGSTHYAIRFDEAGNPSVASGVTGDSRPAREAWKSSEGITPLRSPFYRD